jgi:hypothetical protein
MTQPQSFPLKLLGQPWPGVNTRGGILDMGNGQLTDRSTNVIINAMDTLEKRPGFVRGLDERFFGSVCGLHRYTDEQGREWLLVVDEEGFKVRQPFDVPVFQTDDRLPNDGFVGTADRPNLDRWIDEPLAYELLDGRLRLRNGLTNSTNSLRWFKETPLGIETEIQYTLQDEAVATSTLRLDLLHRETALTGPGVRFAITRSSGATTLLVTLLSATGSVTTTILTGALISLSGIARVNYAPATRMLTVQVFPTTGEFQTASVIITEAQAADLGGWYGLTVESDTVGLTSGFEQVRTVPS